jgi:hypothetical protein
MKMSELKWGRSDYNAETLRLADDLQDLTYGNSNYYSRIEAALEEAEERGRREESEAWRKALGDCGHSTGEHTHAFEWDIDEPCPRRNVWNPYHPQCTKCKRSVGEIMLAIRARLEEK